MWTGASRHPILIQLSKTTHELTTHEEKNLRLMGSTVGGATFSKVSSLGKKW